MEHAARFWEAARDLQAVGVRLTVMDDDGQIQLARQRELSGEELLLLGLVRVVTVVVEADLADGDAFFVLCQSADRLEAFGRHALPILRMDAHRGPDEAKLLRKLERGAAATLLAAGDDDQADAL